jgi:hypothetical protein
MSGRANGRRRVPPIACISNAVLKKPTRFVESLATKSAVPKPVAVSRPHARLRLRSSKLVIAPNELAFAVSVIRALYADYLSSYVELLGLCCH